MRKNVIAVMILMLTLALAGCQTTGGNVGLVVSYPVPDLEAEWIRNGEPIVFEDHWWYPTDNTEVLQDREMLLMGEYKGVPFFTDRVDIRPFNRLYTKFGRNQFRVFEKRTNK